MGKSKFSANKKEELKKKREEPLSTSIGDLLKAKGMAIPESPKPNKNVDDNKNTENKDIDTK